jgi:DGQHR domain-containing protein
VRALDWDEALVAEHRAHIASAGAREAFDVLLDRASRASAYALAPGWHGDIRVFMYLDISEKGAGARSGAPGREDADNWQIAASGDYDGKAPRPGTVLHAALARIAEGGATMRSIQAAISAVGLRGAHPAMTLLKWAAANRGITFTCVNGIVTASGSKFEPESPYAFTVNREHLLFYVKKPGTTRVPGGIDALRALVGDVSVVKNEWTIRLLDRTPALQLEAHLFAQPPVELLSTPATVAAPVPNGPGAASLHTSDDVEVKEEVMATLTIPAACVRQGSLTLYTTSIKVRDLIAPGFYSVETLDPDDANDKGYQRLLNTSRAKKLADYIVKGQDSQDAFLPTSVFLATDKVIPFDEKTHTITFDLVSTGSFSVVDGQHRLEGLRMAADKDPRVLDFAVPVNIAVNLSKIAQMCHFLIVNTTQKSVDKSVEQRIIARLSEALELEDMPSLPKWISNTVQRGEVDRALRFVDFLNTADDSPWKGRIRMANDEDGTGINQKSFVKAIVKYVLTANNPLAAIMDLEKEKKIFLNYWKAISELLDDGNAAVLYKYNGVELFCKFSIPFFMKLQDRGSYTVATMKTMLKHCFDNVEGDYAGVGHPEWWASGSKASFLNAGAINVVSQELSKALNKAAMGASIEI